MPGNDSNTVLLLHGEGADASTTFTDASIGGARGNASVVATVEVDTAQKKWGSGSILFDGDSGTLSFADHADFDLAGSTSQDYTIDFQAKFTDHVDTELLLGQFVDNEEYWQIVHVHGTGFSLIVRTGNTNVVTATGGEITDTNWHHIAMCKVTSGGPTVKWGIYIDGTQTAYVSDTSTATYAGSLFIGQNNDGNYYQGHMDELRIHKSNIFLADPNATPNDTITVPTKAYAKRRILIQA